MTEPFIARWSRLKRARPAPERRPEAPAADLAPRAAPPPASVGDTPPPEPPALPDPAELGAASDALAFLRPEVPEALRNAALRRLWAVDPAIRDFVGPADYAWDFNAPTAMPGFGPLRALDDVTAMVERIFGQDAETGDPAAEVPLAPEAPAPDAGVGLQAYAVAGSDSPGEPARVLPAPLPEPSSTAPRGQAATDPAPQLRRRHGGAVPR